MKLKIENWIEQNKFSENVKLLFKDSIICYKSSAYRASLLFSYLGFMTILKERVISSKKPSIYNQTAWDILINKLNDEDNWEQEIFDASQKRQKINQTTKDITEDAIFSINENLREQIKYWKNRRNDCAHFKNNIIDSFHIESFWAFIESNLPKITVEGGLHSLINNIIIHFDPTYTPPNKDITYLVKEIENSVENTRYKEFWETFLKQGEFDYEIGEKRLSFIIKSLEFNNLNINKEIIEIIKSDKHYLKEFLEFNPNLLIYMDLSDKDVRQLWTRKIINYRNSLNIYASLLKSNYIPKEQIEESNALIASSIKRYEVDENENFILKAHDFFNSLKIIIFNNPKFMEFQWVNDRADLIANIIKMYEADIDVIKTLCTAYNKSTNSNWLLERFDKIFIPTNTLTEDYKKIILENEIDLPVKLKKYFV